MKKSFVLASVLFFVMTNAQVVTEVQSASSVSRWTFGGGASLGFSGGSSGTGTTIGISPRVGYLLTQDFEMGLAGGFSWGNSKYYSSTMLNVGPFANYYISRNFFIGAMFQEYFFTQKDKYYDAKYSGDEAAVYLGAGYLQNVGNHLYIQIGAMYNVLYDKNKSVFGSGFVPNFGIVYGL